MIYEITTDCRIANKDYKKWDIVSHDEIWEYFPSVMSPIDPNKSPRIDEPKAEEKKPETIKEPKEEAPKAKAPAKKTGKKK